MAGKGKGLALGLGFGLVLLFTTRRANAMKKIDRQISAHFRESEFLRSDVAPELAAYEPTAAERRNLDRLVTLVLEPTVRSEFGPTRITGGGRPPSLLTPDEWARRLRAKGYDPARKRSDHDPFAACDFDLPGRDLPTHIKAYERLTANPYVRQVILELHEGPDGLWRVHHIHVAVVTPELPAFTDPDKRAFVMKVPHQEAKPNA